MRNATNSLLDDLQEAQSISSDYGLAKLFGVEPSTISNYRSGRSQLSDEMALKVAALLKRPPASILALLAAERAQSPEVAAVWREAAKILARHKT